MKAKNLFVIATVILILGVVAFPSFGQTIDTIGTYTDHTTGGYFSKSSTGTVDFNGFQGTAGDSASHIFDAVISCTGGAYGIDSVMILFPVGFNIAGLDTIHDIYSSDADLAFDVFRVRNNTSSTGVFDTVVFGMDDGAGGFLTNQSIGAGLDMKFAFKGIINDTSLFSNPPGILTGTSGRFYVDYIRVYLAKTGAAGLFDSLTVSAYIQAAAPDSFDISELNSFADGNTDTAGASLDIFKVSVLDAFGNVLRDTVASVKIEIMDYHQGIDSVGAANPQSGSFIKISNQALYTNLTTSNSNTYVLGADSMKVSGYGYTGADTVKLKVSYDDKFGYDLIPSNVTSDREAAKATPGISTNYTIIAADTPYVFTDMTPFISAPRGDMSLLAVRVQDRFDNGNWQDSVKFTRQLFAGQWYDYADSLILSSDTTFNVEVDKDGWAKILYKTEAGVDAYDSLTITVLDYESDQKTYTYKSLFQQAFGFDIVAGSVLRVRITPTTASLAATDTSRYVSGANVADDDKVKARAGDKIVFLVRLWDKYWNQKDVTESNYSDVSINALRLSSSDVDTALGGKAGDDDLWSGGAESDIVTDPDDTDRKSLRFVYTTNDTASADSSYRVWAWYDKSSATDDTAASDTTFFATIGGPPTVVSGWICSNNLPTDTVQVNSTAHSTTVRAILRDEKGNIADAEYTDSLDFTISGATNGTAGFNDSGKKVTLRVEADAYAGPGWSVDSTVASATIWPDSGKGTLTVSIAPMGESNIGSVAITKLPLQIVSDIESKTSTENAPATYSSFTETALTKGFYSGSSRDIRIRFEDAYGNYIYPDTTNTDAEPKYSDLVGQGQFANLDSISIIYLGDSTILDSIGSAVWAADAGGLLSDTGHVRYTIKADPTENGTDTIIVSWNSRISDTLIVTTTLPSVLDHFIVSVITSPMFADTSMGKAVRIVNNHSVKVEPRDETENPIYSLAFESLNIELIPGSGEMLPADDSSGVDADPVTNPANISWDDVAGPTLTDTSGGQAYALDGSFTNESATFTVNSSKSLKNVTAKVTMVDSNAITVTSTSVATMRWYPMGIDTIEIATSGVVAEQTEFTMTITPKDVYKNIVEDTSYAVGITASASGITGISDEIAVGGAAPIKVTAANTGTVNLFAEATKNLIDNSTISIVGKASITVSTATVNAPTSLAATDAPDDAGGYVMLTFTASANHPGMPGDTSKALPIDYYQVYRNASGTTLADAVHWATITATPLIDASYSTIRAYVSTRGALSNAYYWVAAVVDRNFVDPSDESMAKAAAELGEGVVMGIEVEEAACEAQANVAVMTDDGILISAASDGNKARAINNNAAESLSGADLNADKTVDILDIGIILDILDDAAEYDAVMDLNSDAIVDVFDIGRILDVFNASVDKSSPALAVSDGLNINSSVTMDNVTEDSGEEFSLTIKAEQITEMAGYQFNLVYDPALYEFVSVEEGEFLTAREGTSLFIHNDADGNLVVAGLLFDATDEITAEGEGVLATVKFKWIGDEATAITMNSIKIMDKSQKLNTMADIILEKPIALPDDFALNQNYPNPFNPTTTIKYELPKSVHVDLTIYNILGQRIKTVVSDVQKAGYKKLTWDGTNDMNIKVASGIYIYRLKAGDFVSQKKMVFLK